MGRARPLQSAASTREDAVLEATSSDVTQSSKNQAMPSKDEKPRYGLRKRGREKHEDDVSEHPSKARPFRDAQGDLAKRETTTTRHEAKGKSTSKIAKESRTPPKTYTCRICTEDVSQSRFPRKNACPDSCVDCLTGQNRICKPCIASTITSQLESRDLEKLGCPSCNRPWDYRYLAAFLPHAQIARLDARIVNRAVVQEDNWRWCPHSNCNFGQIHAIDHKFVPNEEWCAYYFCQGCHRGNCFKHRVPWHDNLTCAQYDYRQEHERIKQGGKTNAQMQEEEREALLLMHEQETRICPYCGNAVQKSMGCDSMQCKPHF